MKVFIKPGCPWCVEATRWLQSNGYEFEEVNVLADRAAFDEMKELSGQTKAPTLVMDDGLMLADFGVDELIPFLEENGIQA
ncbi:MAG: glutaredoxin family protein [Verrucomicrobiota bacterium]